MRVRVLSRASALALVQASLVSQALSARWPDLRIESITRTSLGDRDGEVPLAGAIEKGLFTADLSDALAAGDAELVVHSWKDLPVEPRVDTVVAGTLPRADCRDVLIMRADAVAARPDSLVVLTSSPRRAWQLQTSLPPLLPWPVTSVLARDIRGNVPTRLQKLIEGDAHALVVAKAALDRLLADAANEAVTVVRRVLDRCRWMVLPIREFPGAPAQGALAIEVAVARADIAERVRAISDQATQVACEAERAILQSYGGGCHEAIGATVLVRDYGTITSVRGRNSSGKAIATWTLDRSTPPPPRTTEAHIWPRADERHMVERRPMASPWTASALTATGWLISRAEALPADVAPEPTRVVWVAGARTWHKLAARGVWVNGSAEGLGDSDAPAVNVLAGHAIEWHRLTHLAGAGRGSTATYEVRSTFPDDLARRTHFFWTSGSAFLAALESFPAIRHGWHASGPGRTSQVIQHALGATDRASIWLDYEQWQQNILL